MKRPTCTARRAFFSFSRKKHKMLCKKNGWIQGVEKGDKTAFGKVVERLFAVMKKVVNLLKNKDFFSNSYLQFPAGHGILRLTME